MRGISVRVLRSDGVVLVEETLDHLNEVDAHAAFAAGQASAALVEGYTIALQARDPDGLVLPTTEWTTLAFLDTTDRAP